MIFKSINKYYLIILCIFLCSCKSLELLKNNEDLIIDQDYERENKQEIQIINFVNNNSNFYDQYILKKSFFLNNIENLKKIKTFRFTKITKKNFDLLIIPSNKNEFLTLDYLSVLNIYNLDNFELIKSTNILSKFISKENKPISLAYLNKNLFILYEDSSIICLDLEGKVKWEKNFNDISKTPIKIHDNNIILLLSDNIISIDSKNGNINWHFFYKNNEVLQFSGGKIINYNHLLYFILPNNITGEIDTIFGEKNNTKFSKLNTNNFINNSYDNIHIHKNYLSYFDQNKYLTTINLNKDIIMLNNKEIPNVKSSIFFNNLLISLHKNHYLKIFNILNSKIFFDIDISNIISNDDNIINIANSSNSIIIFFSSGNILELDSISGKIINQIKLKIKNINSIFYYHDYLFFNQKNGKITIYRE